MILVNGAHYFSDDYDIKRIFLFLCAVSLQLFIIQTGCQKLSHPHRFTGVIKIVISKQGT